MQRLNFAENALLQARNGSLPENTDYKSLIETMIGYARDQDEQISERSLLTLYYLWVNREKFENGAGSDSSSDEGSDNGSLRSELESLCMNFNSDTREKTRGRKLWIMLRLAFAEKRFSDIENLLEKCGSVENSEYVWERILTVFGDEDEAFRFYPGTLGRIMIEKEEPPSCWYKFVKEQERYLEYAFAVTRQMHGNLSGWIIQAAESKIDFSSVESILGAAARAGQPFPLATDRLGLLYSKKDGTGRSKLHSMISVYMGNIPEGPEGTAQMQAAADRFRFVLQSAPAADAQTGIMEKSSIIALRLFLGEKAAYSDCIRFLLSGISPESRSPEVLHELKEVFTPHLLKMIERQLISDEEIIMTADLLEDGNAYLRVTGATLLLYAVRHGYNLDSIRHIMEQTLSEDPSTSNTFASGKDIGKEELKLFYNLPSAKVFEFDSAEGEDGFMNLRKLTGLLEMCQPPVTATRLRLALETPGPAETKTAGGVKQGRRFQKKSESKNREVIGPMQFRDILNLFSTSGGDIRELMGESDNLQKSLEEKYINELNIKRRGMIRSVFEGGISETPGTCALNWEKISADGSLFPPPLCSNVPESSFDYLAWYLPAIPLHEQKRAYSGIYFSASRILNAASFSDANLENFLRLIAVHELFHSYCEQRTGTYHEHSGESCSYCRLEEAGANRAAFDWGESSLERKEFEPFLDSLLFPYDHLSGKGIPGYGEYNLLDSDAPGWVPVMLKEGQGHPQPPEYAHKRLLLAADFQQEYITGKIIWNGMVETIENDNNGWFLDLR